MWNFKQGKNSGVHLLFNVYLDSVWLIVDTVDGVPLLLKVCSLDSEVSVSSPLSKKKQGQKLSIRK